jgi:hypothetical protein
MWTLSCVIHGHEPSYHWSFSVRFGLIFHVKKTEKTYIYFFFLAFWTEEECLDRLLYYPFSTQPGLSPTRIESNLNYLSSATSLDWHAFISTHLFEFEPWPAMTNTVFEFQPWLAMTRLSGLEWGGLLSPKLHFLFHSWSVWISWNVDRPKKLGVAKAFRCCWEARSRLEIEEWSLEDEDWKMGGVWLSMWLCLKGQGDGAAVRL